MPSVSNDWNPFRNDGDQSVSAPEHTNSGQKQISEFDLQLIEFIDSGMINERTMIKDYDRGDIQVHIAEEYFSAKGNTCRRLVFHFLRGGYGPQREGRVVCKKDEQWELNDLVLNAR